MSHESRKHWNSLIVAAAVAFTCNLAQAQSAQTWVSGFGNDNSPCSVTQPCQTLAGALAKTNAGGEISILDPGPYTGPLTIDKSVTINGVGAIGTVTAPSGATAITISAGASDIVVLRGLSFNGGSVARSWGAAGAIKFVSGATLHVDSCTIFGFAGEGISFLPSAASSLFVNNTSLRSNWGSVIVTPTATGSASATFNNVKFENGTRGIRIDDGTTAIVRNSIATGNNPASGFNAVSTGARPATLVIENSTASFNAGNGVTSNGSMATVRLINVTLIGNGGSGVTLASGGVAYSYGNNRIVGNLTDVSGGTLTSAAQQ
jgi:hypothetical protein